MVLLTIECRICHKLFKHQWHVGKRTGPIPRACSDECRAQRDRNHKNESRKRHPRDKVQIGVCEICHQPIVAKTSSRNSRFHRRCRGLEQVKLLHAIQRQRPKLYANKREEWQAQNHRRRARIGPGQERFSSREIFERDHWRCGLCHKRVDRRRRYPHPEAPTLDHITPISPPFNGLHVRANVQCAHWRCNKTKRATIKIGQQYRLF
jgi:hypothetical protein